MAPQSFSLDPELVGYLSQMANSEQFQQKHRLLGEGLSGKVWEVEGYAVKVYKEDYSEKDDFRMLQRLDGHTAFPKLFYADQQMMVTEKIDGVTLAQIRQSGERLGADIYQQMERNVEDCYRQGIIADDLHLNNLILDGQNKVKIVDVGRFAVTSSPQHFRDQLIEDLDGLKYYAGLFSFSSKRKKHRRHRKHSSSSSRKRYYSSSSRRRHYSSSSSHPRRHRRRHHRSYSSS